MRLNLAILAVLTLVLAGCGSDDGSSASASSELSSEIVGAGSSAQQPQET
jgi:ABC-type phosphate transport system substrate-binding protein